MRGPAGRHNEAPIAGAPAHRSHGAAAAAGSFASLAKYIFAESRQSSSAECAVKITTQWEDTDG